VKIEGVLHEFSSIPGVVEDATDIILNIKQVPIKLNTDLPKTIYVNVENPGPVTSAQIEEDADFAVLDKSVYIATVSEGGKLQIEMRAKNGRGYIPADRNYDERSPDRLHPGGFCAFSGGARSTTQWKQPALGADD